MYQCQDERVGSDASDVGTDGRVVEGGGMGAGGDCTKTGTGAGCFE